MIKKLLVLMCCILLSISLLGCAKLVKTETQEVDVVVTDSYHRDSWIQPMLVGKTMTYICHPAVYRITVKYNNVTYDISGQYVYESYKGCIGQTIKATLEIRYYDDGSVKYDIVNLIG